MNASYLPILIAGLAFFSIMLGAMGLFQFFGNTGEVTRLKERISGKPSTESGGNPLSALWARLGASFASIGSKLLPGEGEGEDNTRSRLMHAGIRHPDALRIFFGVKVALTLGMAGLFLLVRNFAFGHMTLSATMLGATALAAVGSYGPEIWLRMQVGKRQKAVTNAMPDTLDLMVVCVEAGMSLDQAIQRVSSEMRTSGPEISQEFYQLTLELRAGRPRAEALRALASRVGLEDLNSLVSLLIQADMFGIGVGRTLRVYAESMRVRRHQKAEEKAAKLPVMLMLPLILCILPSLFAVIMGPAVIMFIDIFATLNG